MSSSASSITGDLLKSVQLRKTTPVARPSNSPPTASSLSAGIAQERENYNRLRAVDLESWYDALRVHTYPTRFVSITRDQASAMVHNYWTQKRGQTKIQDITNPPCLVELEAEIDRVMGELRAEYASITNKTSSFGVFAKLSSRSPKDATNKHPIIVNMLIEKLQRIKQERGSITGNDIMACIMACSVECLKLQSGRDVLETLCTSDRVCEDDLPLALNLSGPDCQWSQHIVLRQWIDIPIHYELRGFIYNNQLTGLCQYFNDAVFPELVNNQQRVLQLVQSTFDTVKNLVPVEPKEYVMDFAVDLANNKCWIIELNPFGKPTGLGTGTVMFDIEDLPTLFGERPFEFRIETEYRGPLVLREPWKSILINAGFIDSKFNIL